MLQMIHRTSEYGIPKEFLREHALGVFFGKDWPADVFETIDTKLEGEMFDVYAEDDGLLRKVATSVDLGAAQVIASDNVVSATIITGDMPIYIYVTDDSDIYYICSEKEFLKSLVSDLKERGYTTDTERLQKYPNLRQGMVPRYFDEYREFNVEL